jgi:DNA-binding MarR family transcriptional regulator
VFDIDGEAVIRAVDFDFGQVNRDFSGAEVLFHAVVGETLGVSPTDYKCLDLLMRADSMVTAGRLADMSGLTTGAITGVVDRLERAGYVRRLRDPNDRRRILVAPCDGVDAKLAWVFEPLRQAVNALVESEFRNGERDAIRRYLQRMTELLREHTGRLQTAKR